MARILVVDDSSIMRRNLSTILKKAGHNIVGEAANGELAYLEYARCKPDLVTMDITMPILDGIGAVKKIIASHPDANIIMISALDQKYMVLTAIQCGAKHYIIKPFTAEKVIQVVNEVLKVVKIAEEPSSLAAPNMDGAIGDINNAIDDLSQTIQSLDDDTDGDELESLDEEEADDAAPFTVENKNGKLIITISHNFNKDHFSSINMVVQGFMFLKPLKVVLDFGNIKALEADLLNKFVELIAPVKKADGTVAIASRNEDFLKLAKDKLIDTTPLLYKSKEELYK